MPEYTFFYGSSGNPFKLIPEPRFFFLSESNREALACIIYGINERKGLILISGEEGIGKTSLIQYLSNKLDGIASAVIIDQPSITIEQILEQIFFKLNLTPDSREKASLIRQLGVHLIQEYVRGGNLAIFIDDAHKLSKEVAEDLRLLSNLETTHSKLLQIVLVGRPEIDINLDSKDLKAFKQRIVVRGKIGRLTKEESREYIDHHLKAVGSSSFEVFTPEAVSLICRRAKGFPRSINSLCNNALLVGYQRSAKRINSPIVREAFKKRYMQKQWLSGAWAFGEKFFFRKITAIVDQAIDSAYTRKDRLSSLWASARRSLSRKLSYVAHQAINSVYTRKKDRLSSLWTSGQRILSRKLSYVIDQAINNVYTNKYRLSSLWVSARSSLPRKLSYVVNQGINSVYTRKDRLSSLWTSGQKILSRKLSSILDQAVNSGYTQKRRLCGAWAFGQKFHFRKISYPALAAICVMIVIFLFKDTKIIPEKAEIMPLTENLIIAKKVAPPMIERGIDISPTESPLPSSEKIEPKPLIKQLTVMSKGPVHVPPRGEKVPTKNFQAEALKRTATTPSPFTEDATSMEIKKVENTSMNSPSIVPEPVPLPGQFIAKGASEKREKLETKTLSQEVPVITHSFASKQIEPGDIWKVYLNASDPNGDMKYIVGVIDAGGSHLNIIGLKEKNRHHFSGYIYLSTSSTNARLNFTLTIWIKDSEGHLSQPVMFPLSLQTNVIPGKPPQGLFEEQTLGPIMTQIPTLGNLGG